MPGAIGIAELHAFSDLAAIAPALLSSEAEDLFASPAWFGTLHAHGFAVDTPLRLLVAGDPAQRTQLALPLAGVRDVAALANYYSCLYAPITCGAEADPQVLQAVIAHLRRARDRPATLRFAPLDGEGAFARALTPALAAAGYFTDSYFCFGNWYLVVAGRSYATVFAGLPATLRNTVQRRDRRLSREGAWSIDIESGTGPALDAAIADFSAVYAGSWKEPEPFPRFIPALCRMAAALGWLRLGVLKLGTQPIAAQLWLHHRHKSMIYKLAYDRAFERFSPGSILTAAMLQNAIDRDRATEVDYLSGDDAYKREWMSHRRERIGIIAFDPATLRGLAGAARHFAARRLRAWRRPRTPAQTADLG